MSTLQGTYEVSKTKCEDCPVGTYNNEEGQSGESSCQDCPDGSVATSVGSVQCTECPAVSSSLL